MNSLTKSLQKFHRVGHCTYVTVTLQKPDTRTKSREWRIEKYGNLDELTFRENLRRPPIKEPTDVLVRVLASSVNPIDVAMVKGYGANFLNLARKATCDNEFPLVLGRDFVGEVVQRGMGVKDKDVEIGTTVWGVVPVHKPGCHRDFIAINKNYISKKPTNLTDVDASGILYAGLTAWSGIFVTANFGGPQCAVTSQGGGRNKSVLVLGAAGGVGSMAVQILMAEGAIVTATCSTDAVELVKGLGVSNVIDYRAETANTQIADSGPFDLVLDCAGKSSNYATKIPCEFRQYVTYSSPLLRNVDDHGLFGGNVKNLLELIENNVTSLGSQKGAVKWGYFVPAPNGIEYLKRLVETNRLRPITQAVYPFTAADLAYKQVEDGHLRGKIIIDLVNGVKVDIKDPEDE